MFKWRTLLVAFTFVLAVSPSLFGQAASGTATIGGLVTDETGAAVPAADVTVRNVDTNIVRELRSNEAGYYEAVALQPGSYEIKVTKPGFATLTRKGVTVAVGQRAAIDLAIKVSGAQAEVTVVEETPVVETDKSDVSTVVNLTDMMNLPMSGRRWDTFALSTPGTTNDGGFGLLSFRGMSGLYNNNMIDGTDNNQAFFSEAKGRTRLSFAYSIDAIQEYQVGNSSFSAQYGRAAGGVVNAVTKSGTNNVHGTGFYLIRDDSMNAANPFSASQLVALGLPGKPKDRRQQFGASVGGPLKKDKVFYFLNYEQQKRNFPMSVVPGNATFLTSSCTAPGCGQVVSFFKSLVGTQPRQGNESVGLGKADYNLNSRNSISTTVNILRWDSPNGIQTAPSTSIHESMNGSDVVKDETLISRWNSIISPTFLSEFRFQYGRDFEAQTPNGPGPSVSTTNGINFGMANFLPRAAYPNEKRLQFSQNLSSLNGKHSFKFGWDMTRVNDLQINLFSGGGVYSYPTLNSFAQDCGNATLPLPLSTCTPDSTAAAPIGKHYTSFTQAFDSLNAAGKTQFNTWDFAGYVEDTFRPTPSVSINLGLRYEFQTLPTLKGNPLEPRTGTINRDKNNFGPRFGLSWAPTKDKKTVVRLGGGMFYGRTQNSTIANLITNNGQRFVSYTLTPTSAGSPLFPVVLSAPPTAAGSRPDIVFADPKFVNPAIYQGELTLEREVLPNTTVSAIYMVNRAQRMPLFLDTNLPTPTTVTWTICKDAQVGSATTCANPASTFTAPFFTGARPNTNFGFMTSVSSVVNTWYNGVVLQVKRRLSHGLQFDAGFTYAKAQDNDQNSTTFSTSESASNPLNVRNDYSLSDFDQRKRFTVSGVWQLPTQNIQSAALKRIVDGFQISAIAAFVDGRPYSGGTTGTPNFGFTGTTSGILGVGGQSRVPWVGRNTFTAPGTNSIDVRLSRDIRLTERVRWSLIAEAFNVANRYEITSVDTLQYQIGGSTLFPRATFGTRNGSGTNLFGARQFQLGSRVTF